MKLTKDEKIILLKLRRAKEYARNNKQAVLEICVLPEGKVSLVKATFQEKIEIEQMIDSKE